MPRVKPIGRTDPREAAILAELGGTTAAMKITQGELARRAGIPASTLSNRMKNVGEMRLSELWAIRDVRKRAGVELTCEGAS